MLISYFPFPHEVVVRAKNKSLCKSGMFTSRSIMMMGILKAPNKVKDHNRDRPHTEPLKLVELLGQLQPTFFKLGNLVFSFAQLLAVALHPVVITLIMPHEMLMNLFDNIG